MARINNEMMKRAVIAGASHALKYRNESLRISDREVLRKVIENTKKIIQEIEED